MSEYESSLPDTPDEPADFPAEVEGLEAIDAEDLIHRRPSPRKRAVQAGLALLCLLLVLGLFHSISPASLPSAAATPVAIASAAVVGIASNLSFGTVTVDGKPLLGRPPFSIHVSPDGDTIRYVAPPFLPQTCRLFWYGNSTQLGAGGANCELGYSSQPVDDQIGSSYVLNFQFRLEDLPAALQTSAVSFLHQIVTPVSLSTIVPKGQYYATGRDTQGIILSQQATGPLAARVSLLLPQPQNMTSYNSWCSELICAALNVPSVGELLPGSKERLWAIQIPLAINWQFLTPEGQVVGREPQSQPGPHTVLILALNSQQRWRLAEYSSPTDFLDQQLRVIPSSLCTSGMNELSEMLQRLQPGMPNMIPTNDHGVEGCEIQLAQSDGTVIGTVVWRLGVLLAADAKTHTNYPWLPLAPAAELAEVS